MLLKHQLLNDSALFLRAQLLAIIATAALLSRGITFYQLTIVLLLVLTDTLLIWRKLWLEIFEDSSSRHLEATALTALLGE